MTAKVESSNLSGRPYIHPLKYQPKILHGAPDGGRGCQRYLSYPIALANGWYYTLSTLSFFRGHSIDRWLPSSVIAYHSYLTLRYAIGTCPQRVYPIGRFH